MILFLMLNSQTLYNYPDQINYRFFPKKSNDTIVSYFSSNGSWFGVGLPEPYEPDRYGKIAGPYSMYSNEWIGKSLMQFNFGIAGIGKIQLESAKDYEIVQYPGLLFQKYVFESYSIEQKLIFISGRTCLTKIDAINTSEIRIPMSLMIKGSAFDEVGNAEKFSDGWMYKIDGKDDVFWLVRFRLDGEMDLSFNPDNFEFSYKEPVFVEPGDTLSLVSTMSQYFMGDAKQDVMTSSDALVNPDKYFEKNEKLWRYLISNVVSEDREHRNLSVKSLQTMYLNLRSVIPSFKNYFFVEKTGLDQTFVNTDETWFYASSLIRYDTRLSINALASNISNLNQDSSLNSLIPVLNFTDTVTEIGKMPMAAWTAWNIYSVSPDVGLMETIYPMLSGFHEYWYLNHNINNNMWCEDYNGVERPDLNALLFSEKYCLKKIAEVLGYEDDVQMYQQQMDSIKIYFNQYFFDVELLSYVNYDLKDNAISINKDAVGFALWSGLAAWDVAEYYSEDIQAKIEDGTYQKIFDSGDFNIAFYYFLISGLKLYKFEEESNQLKSILLEVVLRDSKNKPIPSYGVDGMKNDNSTLTSSVLLLLLNY